MWVVVAVLVGVTVLLVAAAILFEVEGAWLGAGAMAVILVFSYACVLVFRQLAPAPVGHMELIIMAAAAVGLFIALGALWRLVSRRRRVETGQRPQ